MIAAIAFGKNDCATAVDEFARSQSVIASQIPALQEYGSCLVRLQRLDEAAGVFRQICSLSPGDEKARYNLGVVEALAGRYSDVIALPQPADVSHARPDVLALLAEAYEATGDTPKAVAVLRQAIVEDPAVARYYLDFANICFTHGRIRSASTC